MLSFESLIRRYSGDHASPQLFDDDDITILAEGSIGSLGHASFDFRTHMAIRKWATAKYLEFILSTLWNLFFHSLSSRLRSSFAN